MTQRFSGESFLSLINTAQGGQDDKKAEAQAQIDEMMKYNGNQFIQLNLQAFDLAAQDASKSFLAQLCLINIKHFYEQHHKGLNELVEDQYFNNDSTREQLQELLQNFVFCEVDVVRGLCANIMALICTFDKRYYEAVLAEGFASEFEITSETQFSAIDGCIQFYKEMFELNFFSQNFAVESQEYFSIIISKCLDLYIEGYGIQSLIENIAQLRKAITELLYSIINHNSDMMSNEQIEQYINILSDASENLDFEAVNSAQLLLFSMIKAKYDTSEGFSGLIFAIYDKTIQCDENNPEMCLIPLYIWERIANYEASIEDESDNKHYTLDNAGSLFGCIFEHMIHFVDDGLPEDPTMGGEAIAATCTLFSFAKAAPAVIFELVSELYDRMVQSSELTIFERHALIMAIASVINERVLNTIGGSQEKILEMVINWIIPQITTGVHLRILESSLYTIYLAAKLAGLLGVEDGFTTIGELISGVLGLTKDPKVCHKLSDILIIMSKLMEPEQRFELFEMVSELAKNICLNWRESVDNTGEPSFPFKAVCYVIEGIHEDDQSLEMLTSIYNSITIELSGALDPLMQIYDTMILTSIVKKLKDKVPEENSMKLLYIVVNFMKPEAVLRELYTSSLEAGGELLSHLQIDQSLFEALWSAGQVATQFGQALDQMTVYYGFKLLGCAARAAGPELCENAETQLYDIDERMKEYLEDSVVFQDAGGYGLLVIKMMTDTVETLSAEMARLYLEVTDHIWSKIQCSYDNAMARAYMYTLAIYTNVAKASFGQTNFTNELFKRMREIIRTMIEVSAWENRDLYVYCLLMIKTVAIKYERRANIFLNMRNTHQLLTAGIGISDQYLSEAAKKLLAKVKKL